MKRYINEKGSALLVTLCLLMMLTMIGIMAVNNTNTDIDLAFNKTHSEKAFYISEAGAKRAFVVLNDTSSWRAGFDSVLFSNGLYSVNLIDSLTVAALFDTVLIQSHGIVEHGVADVELTTVPEYNHPFAYGLFGEAGILLDKFTCTDSYNSDSGSYLATQLDSLGSIGSNGTIGSSQSVNFGGDVTVATPGGLALGVNNTVNGDTTSTADSVDLGFIPQSEYDYAKANSVAQSGLSGTDYNYNNGNRTLTTGAGGTVVLTSGIYYFSSVTLGQDSKLVLAPGAEVTIYVIGDIRLGQNSTWNAGGTPSDMIIYSQGSSLQFDQGNTFVGAFFGPNAHIQYDQTTQAFGSLVGGTVQLDQGACFHYDRNLGKIQKYTTGKMFMVAWREM
jgi:hypothetical protein